MPFIHLTTNKILTLHQDLALKENLSQLFSNEDVMLHIEDNQVMYFKDEDIYCMKIDIHVNKKNDDINILKKKVGQCIERFTGIGENNQLFSFVDCLYKEL